MTKKACMRCEVKKPLSAFIKQADAVDGRRKLCRECMRVQQVERYSKKTNKICTKCGEQKDKSEFSAHSSTADGTRNQCRSCCSARKRQGYYEDHAATLKKKRELKAQSAYGITRTQYEKLMRKNCEICGRRGAPKCMDHDHRTGALRGTLCPSCNMSLGMMTDKPHKLRAAALYLEKYSRKAS